MYKNMKGFKTFMGSHEGVPDKYIPEWQRPTRKGAVMSDEVINDTTEEVVDGTTVYEWLMDTISELDDDGLCAVYNHVCSGKLEWIGEDLFSYIPPKEE